MHREHVGSRQLSMHSKRTLVATLTACAAGAAFGQYKCRQADGAVTFQQAPCAAGQVQQRLDLRVAAPASSAAPLADHRAQIADLDRKRLIREAIAGGRPMVSMTRTELDQAMGSPDRVNVAQYGASLQDQLIYHRNGRTLYVYTKDGVVTSIQDTEGMPAVRQPEPSKPCASPREIRDIEIEISKIANRDNERLQTELHKRLLDAKACR